MDEIEEHAKWNKPGTERQTLCAAERKLIS